MRYDTNYTRRQETAQCTLFYVTVNRIGGGGRVMPQLAETLRCKPEGLGCSSRWVSKIFHSLNTSDRTMVPGSTQPVTEMSTRDLPWG